MKCVARCSLGDIVAPLPHAFQVQEDELVLPNGEAIRHGDQFNVAIISHFLVAVKELHPDDEIIVNLNLAFYSAAKSGDLRITNSIAPGFRFLDEETQQALYLFADESVRQAAIADGFVPKGQEGGITVQRTRKDTLVATSTKDQASGEVVFESTGVILPFPVRSTIEIPGDRHLRLTGGSEFIRHSCVPNLRLEIVGDLIRGIALRPIEAGEYLTYNYLCTEWDVTKVFHCQCNVYCCYGVIKGFKYLDREQQEHLLPHCSPAVVEKYRGPLLPSASLGAIHSSSALCHTHTGHLAAQRSISAGTVLLSLVNPPKEKGLSLLLEPSHSCLPHSCDANTVIIENQLVVCRPLVPGDVLTFNLNLQHHDIPDGLPCTCDSASCNKTVKGFHALSPSQQSTLWIYASPEVRQAALQQHHHRITCSSPWATVKESGSMGHATYAAKPITTGTRVFHVKGLILPFPTVYTIHLGEGKHLLFADGAQCLAHSCAPNTRIVVDPMNGFVDCFAMQPIAQDELISFNYLTTEWDMNEPFVCACGSSRCAKMIKGFRHLPRNEQLALWPYATDAIRALFAQSSRSTLANLRMDLVCPLGEKGELCVPKDLPSGTVLLETGGEHFDINGGYICFGDCRIRHSCSATALLLEGKVVLNQSVLADTPITLNINQLVYRLPEAWTCTCGSMHCNQRIMGFQGMPAAQQHELLLGTLPRVRDEAVADGYQNMSDSPYVVIAANGEMGQATFAAKTIAAGTRFFEVTGLVLPFPTVYTILLEPTRHLLFASGAQCLAHSCKPNVRIVVDAERRSLNCVALRPINAGELISFNYLTTEWDMNTAFPCVCGEAGCSGKIRGFKYLAAEDRQRLWWMATPAIRRLAGGANPNWEKLASPTLRTDATGRVCAATELHEGLPVLDAATVELCGSRVVVDGISLNHSCQPTAAIIDHRVVLIQSMCRGVEVTIDLNCLSYALDEPFTCTCPAQPQPHRVEGFQTMPEAQRTARLIFTDAAVRAAALRDGYVVPCPDPLVVVRAHGEMGQATFAATPIAAGARFLSVKGLCLPFPTIYTIMLTESRHLLFADGAQCLAHSCNPNVQICVDFINNVLECVALRPIHEGELIAFNYNTTEWHMSSPFRCACGAPSCAYEIRGFKHLTRAARESILPQVSPTIRQLALDHADVQLPAVLRSREDGTLEAAATLPKEFVVLEVMYLDVQPAQLCVGRNCFIPHHSTTYNCVLVEGRIVTCAEVAAGSPLLINMNYFVYDMTAQFPRAYVEDCKGFKYMEEALKQKYLYLCEPPVRAQAMRDGWIVHSSQDALTVRPNGEMGQTAYATRDIATGTTLFHCDGLIVPFPTMYTICVGPRRHLLFGDAAECIAHHCDPNVRVTVNGDGTFDFVTITPIATGEMVTFNYTTTEWLMNSPFVCLCGSTYCAGIVQGFKHLSNADCQRLWPITSDVVREEYRKRANNNNSDHAMKA